MKRRAVAQLIAAGFLALPSLAKAQQLQAQPKIGLLVAGTPDPAEFVAQFRVALSKLGYVDGDNVAIVLRSAGSTELERLRVAARDLVDQRVNVIVTLQTPPTEAARDVTHDVPIVMAGVGDPVGTGLVASLAHPGGNITGVSTATTEVAAKNIGMLRELLPSAKRVGALCNANDPFSKPFLAAVQRAGRALGLEIVPGLPHGASEAESAYALLKGIDAVIVQPSLGVGMAAELTLRNRMPSAAPNAAFARAGGLLSYSASNPATYRMAAAFTERILKGAKPADLPVEEPTEFEFVVNLKTARALGIAVPPSTLVRADEVLE